MITNIPTINFTKAPALQPIVKAIWSGVNNQIVAVISRPTLAGGVLTAGVVFGTMSVWVIDQIFQKKHEQLIRDSHDDYYRINRMNGISNTDLCSPLEANFKNRLKTIYAATLLLPGTIAIATWKTSSFARAYFNFSFFTIGFALGAKAIKYYYKNSARKMDELFELLKKDSNIKLGWKLNLSCYQWGYLRYMPLPKLGEKIFKEFDDCDPLILQSCGLTNKSLRDLKEADWFSHFSHIDVNHNTQLTAEGIICIAEGGADELEHLDLSDTDLTDNDLIQMAESGRFNNLQTLSIYNNPQITGKGIARIAESGFEKLTMLDIGCNPQLLGKGLDEWIGTEGFKSLEALGLSSSDLTTDDLVQMIDRSEWFKGLKGLDLEFNEPTLLVFPSNISKMTNISKRTPTSSYDDGYYTPFRGVGIFLTSADQFEFELTPQSYEFFKAYNVRIRPLPWEALRKQYLIHKSTS